MNIYYNDGYETYTITSIEYEYGEYMITKVTIYFDEKEEKYSFQGLLSLPEIIRELSYRNVFS